MNTKQSGGTILVIDDDVNIRAALGLHLEMMGFTPITAADGPSALALLREHDILVAIVDLKLPGMSGLEVARAIREHDATIQCIILTGFASLESAVQALREQVYDYIAKPVGMIDLGRILGRAVEYARALRREREMAAMLARRSAELEQSLAALREAQGRLIRTANAALMGQLAEGLRHELGNALTIIRLNMNLLAYYRNDPDKFARHIHSLEHGVDSIERIAVALRHFPIEDGEEGELLDLAQVVRQAASQAQQAIRGTHGSLSLDLEAHAPVRGFIFQWMRALISIIENAIEASANAKPGPPQISITLRAEGNRWRISIQDNGPGFTPEALEHALEPGFTTKVERGFVRGLGLGLFVASHVIERHGGLLRLSNRPEGGALVEIWLPQASTSSTTDSVIEH